jgi:hypothetical protein
VRLTDRIKPRQRSVRRLRGTRFTRAILVWGLFWFIGLQLSVIFYLEWRHPEFLDPKYGFRACALRTIRSARSEHSLILVLGSSRAEQGFRAGLLNNSSSEKPLFFFNLARGGSSPLLYLLTLRRLLDDGIRPDHLLVEIFPPSLAGEKAGVTIYKPTLRDLPQLVRYSVNPRTWAYWLQDRLLLWFKFRNEFLVWAAPQALPRQARWGEHLWNPEGGEWRMIGEHVSLSERRRLVEDSRSRYFDTLQHFRIDASADRALRELLETCRRERIGVVLFLMPEARIFRRWYPETSERSLSAYLNGLLRQFRVPLIDARFWIEDANFSDGHHLLGGGAARFTRRFASEVLADLEQGN